MRISAAPALVSITANKSRIPGIWVLDPSSSGRESLAVVKRVADHVVDVGLVGLRESLGELGVDLAQRLVSGARDVEQLLGLSFVGDPLVDGVHGFPDAGGLRDLCRVGQIGRAPRRCR